MFSPGIRDVTLVVCPMVSRGAPTPTSTLALSRVPALVVALALLEYVPTIDVRTPEIPGCGTMRGDRHGRKRPGQAYLSPRTWARSLASRGFRCTAVLT